MNQVKKKVEESGDLISALKVTIRMVVNRQVSG